MSDEKSDNAALLKSVALLGTIAFELTVFTGIGIALGTWISGFTEFTPSQERWFPVAGALLGFIGSMIRIVIMANRWLEKAQK